MILILPGFSPRNKTWADEIKTSLLSLGEVEAISWQHWPGNSPAPHWTEAELEKIANKFHGKPIMIVAKSIGTYIAAQLLEKNANHIVKLVLCGLPLNDLNRQDQQVYRHLSKIYPKKTLVLQNNRDPHGNDIQVVQLFKEFKLNIPVVSKEADNHEYLYAEDIHEFLKE